MTVESSRVAIPRGETRVNVASLLQETVGGLRDLTLDVAQLPLADGLVARNVRADVRLTLLKDAILADVDAQATVPLECVTCLDEFEQEIVQSLSEEYRQQVDVRTGAWIPPESNGEVHEDDEEPAFTIDESHELDLGEALRQWIVLAIPMQPSCGPDCPGPELRSTGGESEIDDRFASLASLLDDEDDETS